ncbi:putative head morphogenesis protein [Vibrio phage 1.233.A._10N.261.51.E6]|nr:putative head morphogenesis protein [Vibrio phage 1.233.A._10N.261.51.E6]AUR96877.1 putative head morphogenesis protein [Vibrio phage 1.233.B._10N.261.51.E6]
MPTSQILTDAEIEHQQYLIRYSQGKANTIKPFLRDVVAYLEARLAREGESIASKKKLNALLKDTQKKMNTIYTDWEKSEFNPMFREVVKSELVFQEGATNAVVAGYNATVPAQGQVLSAALNSPLLVGAKGGAVDFSKYTKGWRQQEIERVNSRIVAGFYSGETTSQITRGIVGLKSQNYANGILNMSRANIQSMVKTTATHLSMEAQSEFNKENSDLIIGMQWVSTLDSNTSAVCRDRDGEIYYFSEYGQNYPRPAAHPNCRSTMTPVLSSEYDFLTESRTRPAVSDGKAQEVSGKTTYYEWLNRQPAKVVDEALGPEKGKIFRNAGLTPEEYKKAATDQFGNPLSIEAMSRKNEDITRYLNKQR